MSDDLEADIKRILSQLLMAASQIAKLVAEKQREYLRDMERLTAEQARKTQALFDEGYRQAQQVYSRVARDEYWAKQGSDPFIEELTQAYGAAKTYAPFRPDAAMAARRIEDECKKRWEVDISATQLNPQEAQTEQEANALSSEGLKETEGLSAAPVPVEVYVEAANLMDMSSPEKIAEEAANLHAATENTNAVRSVEHEEANLAVGSDSAEAGREIHEDTEATAAWDSAEAREAWLQSRAGRFPVQAERGVLLADMSQGQPFRERLQKAKATAAGKPIVKTPAARTATQAITK